MQQNRLGEGVYVGRRPVYDRVMDLFAYELLYHAGDCELTGDCPDDERSISSRLITHAFMSIGLENLVGSRPALFGLTGEFFTGSAPLPMSGEQVIVGLRGTEEVTPGILEGMRALSEQGYRIFVDYTPALAGQAPLLEVADIVRIDVQGLDETELAAILARLRRPGLHLLAGGVDSKAQHETCHRLGFDYFQGFFLSEPDVVQHRAPTINRAVILNLIRQLQQPTVDLRALEQLIVQDMAFSYQLLRYINCATFGLRREIDSVRQAVALLGTDTVRKWATLLLMDQLGDDKPEELMVMAMVRARMCELLATGGRQADASQAFTVGLFSLLDALLDTPMEELLDQMPLSAPIKLALLDGEGPLGGLLRTVVHYERGEWDEIPTAETRAIDYNKAYVSALQWADANIRNVRTA